MEVVESTGLLIRLAAKMVVVGVAVLFMLRAATAVQTARVSHSMDQKLAFSAQSVAFSALALIFVIILKWTAA